MDRITKKDLHILHMDGHELVFEIEDDMVNATRMSSSYGTDKHPSIWLQTREAAGIREIVSAIKGCPEKNLVEARGEGDHTEIWMDMGLAISYAGWLLPAFMEWCAREVRRLKEEIARRDLHTHEEEDEHRIIIHIHRSDDLPS
jgi:hypothetical protein|nr:MAG TPA_asm: KilA-N domain [Caudoviricetes sp.]